MHELSGSQKLIWTGQTLQPGEPLYNMALAFCIEGHVDAEAMRQAFEQLVLDCDSLRAVFRLDGGSAKMQILDRPPEPLKFLDFSDEEDPEASIAAWTKSRSMRSFDPGVCLYDSALLKANEHCFTWYLNQHHLITDAWAVSKIFERVEQYYRLARDKQLNGTTAPPAYVDYLAYERKQRDSRMYQVAVDYWARQLPGSLERSRFYRAVPEERSAQTERIPCAVGSRRSDAIRTLALSDGFRTFTDDMSFYQVLCTALFAFLHRVTAKSQIAIGTPSHNRASAKLKETIGLLIEIFPVVVNIDQGETFRSLYEKVADKTRELLMHSPPGSSGAEHNRAYDVLLNYITANFGDFDGNKVRSDWVHADYGDRNHLLRLQVHDFDRAGEFELFFDLNIDAFAAEERQWVGSHFLDLLDAFIAEPDTAIGTVALRAGARLHAPANEHADAATDPGENDTVIAAFQRRVDDLADAVALQCGDTHVSYGELDGRSNALAAELSIAEAESRRPVALIMRRSIESIVAILGVLKSGRPYVPIDPDYPAARIRFMLADSAADTVLSDSSNQQLANSVAADRRIFIVDCESELETQTRATLPKVSGADAAYIIYTSGSTGKPKGVLVSHANLAHYVGWASRFYVRERRLSFAFFSSLSFDLTVTSIFTPLVSGGSIVVYPELEAEHDITIRRVVEDDQTDVIKLTPAHLALLQAMDLSTSRLKTLILGGEDLKTGLCKTISNYFGDSIELYNEYGPTEASVACMIHRFDPLSDTATSVPIGKANDHSRIYVLDTGLNPVPRGVTGTIYIGGPAVALGYVNNPELTEQRFVADPFAQGGRMYDTGDLGRWNEQGVMEFLGRADQQVKIRGVRIEPGEIEAAIREIDGISDAAVVPQKRVARSHAPVETAFCVRCGLSAAHPQARLDTNSVCGICRHYEKERDLALGYFKTLDDLAVLVKKIRAESTATPDCIMLLSGGKDSTYALCRLVDMGLTPLVFTMDNGFISEGAKANIRRIVDHLGLELVVGETPHMNEIFADSLKRFSNVCEGCFKTIYTLSMNLAVERGIRYICTGLSRGQIFQTRVADLFRHRMFDPQRIDQTIIEARKAYHRLDDVVSNSLDVEIFRRDEVFEEIQYLDFYRYTDVTLDEMLTYLSTRAPWVRPSDTGRSTNCLINDVGIYVHKRQRGHHNYSLPYSWDVRLGHKERDAARSELDDQIDEGRVKNILKEIGFGVADLESADVSDNYLVGYYVASKDISEVEVLNELRQSLPASLVPRFLMRLDSLPLTANGKLDTAALPDPLQEIHEGRSAHEAAATDVEKILLQVWGNVLGVSDIGVTDNFFELGGDSILNIQIVALARKYGVDVSPQQIFDCPTVRELAAVASMDSAGIAEQGSVSGAAPLTPIQKRYFEMQGDEPVYYCQTAVLDVDDGVSPAHVERALHALLEHHDALRTRFVREGDELYQDTLAPGVIDFQMGRVGAIDTDLDVFIASELDALAKATDPTIGQCLQASYVAAGEKRRACLLIAIQHLVVDGVSWWLLVEDIEKAIADCQRDQSIALPPKTTSYRAWSGLLNDYASSPGFAEIAAYWRGFALTETTSTQPDKRAHSKALAERQSLCFEMSRAETRALLLRVSSTHKAQVPEALLAAMAPSLAGLLAGDELLVDIEGHGRESVMEGTDLLRTIGWFTTVYPVSIKAHALPQRAAADRLTAIKGLLRTIPNRGFDYGVLRYSPGSADTNRIDAWRSSPVLFNYLGQWNSKPAGAALVTFKQAVGVCASPSLRTPYQIEINAVVFDGILRIDVSYDGDRYQESQIQQLFESTRASLEQLAAASTVSPIDVSSVDLSKEELADIIAEFGE